MRILGQIIAVFISLLHLSLILGLMLRLCLPLILIHIQYFLFLLTSARVTVPFLLFILKLLLSVVCNVIVGLHIHLLGPHLHLLLARQCGFRVPCLRQWYLQGLGVLISGMRFYLFEDVVELLVGGLVIGVIGPVFLQEILADLQLLLDVSGD